MEKCYSYGNNISQNLFLNYLAEIFFETMHLCYCDSVLLYRNKVL